MITGYLRVSTSKQNLANQQDEIRRFAESRQLTIETGLQKSLAARNTNVTGSWVGCFDA